MLCWNHQITCYGGTLLNIPPMYVVLLKSMRYIDKHGKKWKFEFKNLQTLSNASHLSNSLLDAHTVLCVNVVAIKEMNLIGKGK